MARVTVIQLQSAERAALEQGFKHGTSPAFRQRCHMILLKSQGHTSSQVAQIVGVCEMAVHNWVHRYLSQGIAGLQTKPGRGRKAILQDSDLENVKAAVAAHRQRLDVARAELEQTLDKSFCQMTCGALSKKRWRL